MCNELQRFIFSVTPVSHFVPRMAAEPIAHKMFLAEVNGQSDLSPTTLGNKGTTCVAS